MNILMTLPVLLLSAGLIGSIVMYIRHRKNSASSK